MENQQQQQVLICCAFMETPIHQNQKGGGQDPMPIGVGIPPRDVKNSKPVFRVIQPCGHILCVQCCAHFTYSIGTLINRVIEAEEDKKSMMMSPPMSSSSCNNNNNNNSNKRKKIGAGIKNKRFGVGGPTGYLKATVCPVCRILHDSDVRIDNVFSVTNIQLTILPKPSSPTTMPCIVYTADNKHRYDLTDYPQTSSTSTSSSSTSPSSSTSTTILSPGGSYSSSYSSSSDLLLPPRGKGEYCKWLLEQQRERMEEEEGQTEENENDSEEEESENESNKKRKLNIHQPIPIVINNNNNNNAADGDDNDDDTAADMGEIIVEKIIPVYNNQPAAAILPIELREWKINEENNSSSSTSSSSI